MKIPAAAEAVFPLKEADEAELRKRMETVRGFLIAVTDALPEQRPVPRRAVQALSLFVEAIIDGED
jgi:hypothetical protein